MPENVIITLRYQGKETDFEIPSGVPVSLLEESLKRAMKLHFPGLMLQEKRLMLKSTEGYLLADKTLADYSIFDGAVLELDLVGSVEGRTR